MEERQLRGSIRIRLRIENNDERQSLLASVTPAPDIYVNVRRKKSMAVARYTCRGEYDNEEKFALKVLLGYIDELKDHFLRRLVYFMNDSVVSLFFWRGQVKCGCGNTKLPLYSLSFFCMGIIFVEIPQLIPAMMCLFLAWIMLINMWLRRSSPSPWYRCRSFLEYCHILLYGKSPAAKDHHRTIIKPYEGWSSQKALEVAQRQRDEKTERFMKLKEAAEKEVEDAQNVSKDIHSKSKASLVPIEILVILGKVQGIVGNICRLLRFVDSIITWEASDLSFWITAVLLVAGVLFIFIPWAFILTWLGRIVVVLVLGPQNMLWDVFSSADTKNTDDEHRIKHLLAERWFQVRCQQEKAGKLKAFRHVLFGKYSTSVPPMTWTPHQDVPLPASSCFPADSQTIEQGQSLLESREDLPLIPGQKLYGLMVPRPFDDYNKNKEESDENLNAMKACLPKAGEQKQSSEHTLSSYLKRFTSSNKSKLNEGTEILEKYDEEVPFIQNMSNVSDVTTTATNTSIILSAFSKDSNNSLRGDVGVEITEEFTAEAEFVERVHSFPAHFDNRDDDSDDISDDDHHDEDYCDGGGNNDETYHYNTNQLSTAHSIDTVGGSGGDFEANGKYHGGVEENGNATNVMKNTSLSPQLPPQAAARNQESADDLGFEVTGISDDHVNISWSSTWNG